MSEVSLWEPSPWRVEALEPRLLLSGLTAASFAAGQDYFSNFHIVYDTVAHAALSESGLAIAGPLNVPMGSSGPVGLTPTQIRHAYGIDQVTFGSVVGDGTGQTIAIVDAYNAPSIVADLHAFDQAFFPGQSDPALTVVGQSGTSTLPGTDPAGPGAASSWSTEISLDVEWAHAMAPKASILLVEANSNSSSDLYAAVDTARNRAGVSVVSMSWGNDESSWDSGNNSYFTTPGGHIGVTFLASTGDNGAGVLYPSSSPNVVAVGGTTLNVDGSGNYTSESGWSGSGGGISAYQSQPTYQQGVVSASIATTMRAVPDVAADADPSTGVAVYDSYDFGSDTPWGQIGGTSLSCPLWAGMIAVVNQGRGLASQPSLDGATQTLATLYNLPAADFHDITTGNNGFAAQAGYDLVTGLGTPVANRLIPALVSVAVVPSKLAFTQQPTSTIAGNLIDGSGGVRVAVEDSLGNTMTTNYSTVTLTLSGGTFAYGSTTVSATAYKGIAIFNNLSGLVIDAVGSYTLTASDGALIGATSNTFTISPAAAAKLAFTQQPTSSTAGVALSPIVTVAVQDQFGNTVTTDSSGVTLMLSGRIFASGGNTASATSVNGVATFSGLTIDIAGNYTLTASDGALISVTSGNFTIIAAAAAKLEIAQQPSRTMTGIAITPAVRVLVQDQFGNTVTTDSSTVTLMLNGGAFATGGDTATVASLNGNATFYDMVINTAGNYTLTASDGVLAGDTSSGFTIFPPPPTVVSINRESPAGPAAGPPSVTYAVTFSEPVAGVTSSDFQLALTGGTSASSTVVVSPGTGYNSAYTVTVNGMSGNGTLGLNLVDNGSIVDAYGDHLANSSGALHAQQTLALGSNPVFVAVADLNGDGKADLVFTDGSSGSALLGNGDGSFQTAKTFGGNSGADFVAVADVNGDGKLDLVIANYYSNNVGVLLGYGDGTFQAEKTYSAWEPSSVAVADVDGDGNPDLIVANDSDSNDSTLSVLLGNGDGTFKNGETVLTDLPACFTVAPAADVNGDGNMDLVINNGLNVGVLLGNGDGTFQAQEIVATGIEQHAQVADVNGDGKPDLVVINSNSNNVSALLGNGDGTFQAPKSFSTGIIPDCLALADVNGDGKPDLAVTNSYSNNVSVMLGNGDGTFQAQRNFNTGTSPDFLVSTDINGDGKPDLIVANDESDTISGLLGNNSVTGQLYNTMNQPTQLAFTQQPTSTAAGAPIDPLTGVQVAVEDAYGNIVTADNTSNVTLTLNSGTFASGGNTATVAAVNGIATFTNLIIDTVGNYTLTAGDGGLTIATSAGFTVVLTASKLVFATQPSNAGGGAAISPAVTVGVENPLGIIVAPDASTVTLTLNGGTFASGGSTATAAAVNGVATFRNLIVYAAGTYTLTASDGSLTGATSSNFTVILPPTVASINRASPAGSIAEPSSVTYAVTFSTPVTGVTSADFQLVLTGGTAGSSTVVVSPGSGYSSVYNVTVSGISGAGALELNLVDNGSIVDAYGNHIANANGAFQAKQTFATGSNPRSVAVADVNGDGKPDLVVANGGSNTVSVLLGSGNGVFQAQQTFATGSDPGFVAVADVNGDGKPDLVVANGGSNTVSVLLGNGNGAFQAQRTFATGSDPYSLAVADVNGDGKPDIITANYWDNKAGVLLGNGDGTFQTQKTFATGWYPTSIAAADVNGDGKPDLVVANSNNVGVLLGNGDGTFQAQTASAVSSQPWSVAAADVNGDGKPDLVVATSNNVGVLLGNGNGTFQAQKTFAAGENPASVAVADVNGDGKPDLVVANDGSDSVGVLLGNGDGTFQAQRTSAAGSAPTYVTVADLNGDGKSDLVVANYSSYTVSVLLGNDTSTGQLYTIDPPTQLAFTQPPASTTAGNAINPGTGIQVVVKDAANATVGIDSSVVTLTLSGGTFAGGGTTAAATAVNGIATFSNLIVNTAGTDTLTASDGALTDATSGSFTVYPLGDVNLDGVVNATDIDQLYAHLGDTTGRYDLNNDSVVNQADVDYLVKNVLHTGYGDANLDRKIDFVDFQVLLDHWQFAGLGWATGDFTGDGKCDFLDLQKLLDNWNPAGFAGSSPQLSAASDPSGTVTGGVLQDAAASMPVSAASAVAAPLSSDSSPLIQAGATLTSARSDVNSPSNEVADLLATATTLNGSARVPTAKATVLSRRSSRADDSWKSDDNEVDMLTQLINPVVLFPACTFVADTQLAWFLLTSQAAY